MYDIYIYIYIYMSTCASTFPSFLCPKKIKREREREIVVSAKNVKQKIIPFVRQLRLRVIPPERQHTHFLKRKKEKSSGWILENMDTSYRHSCA